MDDIWFAGSKGANASQDHSITQLSHGVGRRGPPTHSCTYITDEHTEDETHSARMQRIRGIGDEPLYRVSRTYSTPALVNKNFRIAFSITKISKIKFPNYNY